MGMIVGGTLIFKAYNHRELTVGVGLGLKNCRLCWVGGGLGLEFLKQ